MPTEAWDTLTSSFGQPRHIYVSMCVGGCVACSRWVPMQTFFYMYSYNNNDAVVGGMICKTDKPYISYY